jgi:predicted ester cyclase
LGTLCAGLSVSFMARGRHWHRSHTIQHNNAEGNDMSATHPSGAESTAPLHERLLDLWAAPIPDPQEAQASFALLYTDPVTINGGEVPLSALVTRAGQTHTSLERLSVKVLDVIETPGKVVLAFELTARHVGAWHSALGDVPATGRTVTVRTIDVLTVDNGLVTAIWVVSDEAALLTQLGARL